MNDLRRRIATADAGGYRALGAALRTARNAAADPSDWTYCQHGTPECRAAHWMSPEVECD